MATRTRNSARIAANASSKGDDQAKNIAPPSSKKTKSKSKPVSKADKALNDALKDARRQDAAETEAARRAQAELRKFLVVCVVRGGLQY